MSVVVAFDVDGTLTRRDCVLPFLVRVGGRRAVLWSFLRRPAATVAGLVRGDRDHLKEVLVGGVLRDRPLAQIERIGQQFAADVHRTGLRTDTVERLRWHQSMGHHTVLVSASLGVYLRPLARLLGVDAVLSTEVGVDGGHCTDRLDGRNCRGAEKAHRLEAWLAEHDLADAELWAYGDSRGDDELLTLADRPERVAGVVVAPRPTAGGAA
jgi:phosphatidylglycerophosphatase C